MIIYILLVIYLYLASLWKNKIIFFLSFLILFVICGFRDYSVGTDTANYLLNYELNSHFENEYLFQLIINFLLKNGIDYRYLLYISSMLTLIPIFYVAYKRNENFNQTILLYVLLSFYLLSFNIIRQCIAVSIVFLGIYYFEKSQVKKFLFCIVIASLFHFSAIFSLFILLLNKIKLKVSSVYIFSILMFTYISPLVFNFTDVISFFFNFFNIGGYDIYIGLANKEILSINRFLLNVFICLIYHNLKDKNNLHFKIVLFGIIMLNIFPSNSIIGRISFYFMISQIFLYVDLINKKTNMYILIILYSVVLFSFNLYLNNGQVVPYKFGF